MPTSSLKLIQAFIYGLTPIIIPIVFHTREVNEIFKLLLFDDNNEIALQIKHFPSLAVGTNSIFRKIPRKFTTASLRNNSTR